MSTNQTPAGRQSPQVYRRRRLLVLIGLIAVIVAVVLIIVRPGSSQGDDSGPTSSTPTATAPATSDPTTIPTEPTAADGDPCAPEKILVEAVTDKSAYEAAEQPQLSVTITNTGKNICVLNAGTAQQVFTIKSGEELYWTSTDCQVDAIDAEVSLTPGAAISSAVPIIWDRTRSSPETCNGPRETVPAGGASYHLSVSVDSFESAESKQFQLY